MKVEQGTLDWQIANNFIISERDHEDQSLGGGRGCRFLGQSLESSVGWQGVRQTVVEPGPMWWWW